MTTTSPSIFNGDTSQHSSQGQEHDQEDGCPLHYDVVAEAGADFEPRAAVLHKEEEPQSQEVAEQLDQAHHDRTSETADLEQNCNDDHFSVKHII